jgi:type IV secretion system protein VirB9
MYRYTHSDTSFVAIVTVLVLGSACATTPPPRFVRAQPAPEPAPPPAIVQVPTPVPVPGQLRPEPTKAPPAKQQRPLDVVRAANAKAAAAPDDAGFFNAVMTYDFMPGALYQIYGAPLRFTDVQLQPGEKIVGKPTAGDTIRWITARGVSGANGAEQQHLYIKPTRPDLKTTIAINTDRRTYLLEVESYDDTYMAAVQWRYPQDDVAQLEAANAQQTALAQATVSTRIDLEALNFAYEIDVARGRPAWVPAQVFDDGHKTYIKFPPSMLEREAPVLFVVSSSDDTQIVNYRVRGQFYVVDRLFDRAELRLGQKDQDVVRIVRHR